MPDIVISATDHYTQVIKTLSNSTRAFTKDIAGTQERLDELNRTKVALRP